MNLTKQLAHDTFIDGQIRKLDIGELEFSAKDRMHLPP